MQFIWQAHALRVFALLLGLWIIVRFLAVHDLIGTVYDKSLQSFIHSGTIMKPDQRPSRLKVLAQLKSAGLPAPLEPPPLILTPLMIAAKEEEKKAKQPGKLLHTAQLMSAKSDSSDFASEKRASPYSASQHSASQHSASQHSASQHGTSQHSASQHSVSQSLASSLFSPSPWFAPVSRNDSLVVQGMADWALSSWFYWRDGSDRSSVSSSTNSNPKPRSMLGGSQFGARLSHGVAANGLLRAFVRFSEAPDAAESSEVALGLAFRLFEGLPLDLNVERRQNIGGKPGKKEGYALYGTGGVSDVTLPFRFRLDAYGQAGVVINEVRTGFVETAFTIDRVIAENRNMSLNLGFMTAASVQRGAHRVDIGPRVVIRTNKIGKAAYLAIDWRQRVGGQAYPDSGITATLAADF